VTVRDAVNQDVLVGANGEYVVGEEVGRVLAGAVVELVECDDEGTMTIGLPFHLPDDSVSAAASVCAVSVATGDRGVNAYQSAFPLHRHPCLSSNETLFFYGFIDSEKPMMGVCAT
jgi:hypothetical protein